MPDFCGGRKNEHLEHFTVSIFHREREVYSPQQQQQHPLLHLGKEGERQIVQTDKKELLLFWFCHRHGKVVRDQLIKKKDFHPHCCPQARPVSAQQGLGDGKLHRDGAGRGREGRSEEELLSVGGTLGVLPAHTGSDSHSLRGRVCPLLTFAMVLGASLADPPAASQSPGEG